MEELQQKNHIPRVSCVNGSNPTSEILISSQCNNGMKFGGGGGSLEELAYVVFGRDMNCCDQRAHCGV